MTEKKQAPRKRSKAAKPRATPAPAKEEPRGDLAAPAPSDPLEGRMYTTGSWKGLPNYECLWCAFSTVDHETALEHYEADHQTRPKEARIINTGLVGEDGEPIKRVEPAEED